LIVSADVFVCGGAQIAAHTSALGAVGEAGWLKAVALAG
jgi:hypothetical protein